MYSVESKVHTVPDMMYKDNLKCGIQVEKIYITLKRVFHWLHVHVSRHLRLHQKYPAVLHHTCMYSLLGV